MTDSTVTLSWMTSPYPNGAVIRYDVQYTMTHDFFFTTRFTSLTGTVTGLTSNTYYGFRVAAVTIAGRGPFTYLYDAITGKLFIIEICINSNTDGPPANVNAAVVSPHSVKVTWDPLSVNSLVINYNISFYSYGELADVVLHNMSTNITINGLEEFASYDITVLAVYSGGLGPSSDSVRVTTWSDSKLN